MKPIAALFILLRAISGRAIQPLIFWLLIVAGNTATLADERRDRDAREPGMRVGAFRVAPAVKTSVGYDSNLFLGQSNLTTSGWTRVAPSVVISSDWNRHAVRLEADAELGLFTQSSADQYLDGQLGLAGQADITRRISLSAELIYERGHEARGSDDVPGLAAEPVTFSRFSGTLGGEFRLSPLRIRPSLTARRVDYDDVGLTGGGTSNQDDRDRDEIEGELRVGFRFSPGYEIFLQSGFLATDYLDRVDDGGANRDSFAVSASGGVRLRLTRLLEGTVSAGLKHTQFQDPAFRDTTDVIADAALTWTPTPRLTVDLGLTRGTRQSTLPGTAQVTDTELALGAAFEATRLLTLQATGGFTHSDSDGANQSEQVFNLGLGADWAVLRTLTLSPRYEFGLRSSNVAGRDYQAHRVLIEAAYAY
ncbi:MAG: outer membrane beta-barrel protein [Pseudomonadota bacterium]